MLSTLLGSLQVSLHHLKKLDIEFFFIVCAISERDEIV
jgi:hypothetical protein